MRGIFCAWHDKGMASKMKQIWRLIRLEALHSRTKILLEHTLTTPSVSSCKSYIATSSLLGACPDMQVGL
jgi:hypothetical protein